MASTIASVKKAFNLPVGGELTLCDCMPSQRKRVRARRKAATRRAVLKNRNYDVSRFKNIDFVDAALCAVTAETFRKGYYKYYGKADNGILVMPT